MVETKSDDTARRLRELQKQAEEHTQESLAYMAEQGIRPEGRFGLFLPPASRQQDIQRLRYKHSAKQVVVYETEQGEFSALCPFSGLPDFGVLRIEYVPGEWILELKSLKYYLLSWRNIGAAQEDITATIYEDLFSRLVDPEYLTIISVYNIRGGIRTTCTIDSRSQQS